MEPRTYFHIPKTYKKSPLKDWKPDESRSCSTLKYWGQFKQRNSIEDAHVSLRFTEMHLMWLQIQIQIQRSRRIRRRRRWRQGYEQRMSAFDRFAGQHDLCLLISESVVQKFTFNCLCLYRICMDCQLIKRGLNVVEVLAVLALRSELCGIL